MSRLLSLCKTSLLYEEISVDLGNLSLSRRPFL
jgi:hypothetical protein